MPTINRGLLKKSIAVQAIPEFIDEFDYVYISRYMNGLEPQSVENQPWPQYQTDATVSFCIAHNHQNLILKFEVKEKQLNAAIRQENADVHKDNCVELFIAIGEDDAYYNLEFNCLGSAKIGYGTGKEDRTMLHKEAINQIQVYATLDFKTNVPDPLFVWEMFLIIPKTVFQFSTITTFEGLKCRANFYKCGDNLKEPHFLAWNMIHSALPDFHQPEFFGELIFT